MWKLPKLHTPGGTRTHNRLIRSQTPYPLGHRRLQLCIALTNKKTLTNNNSRTDTCKRSRSTSLDSSQLGLGFISLRVRYLHALPW